PQPVRERLVSRACLWLVEHDQRQVACRLAHQYLPRTFFVELLQQSLREWFRAGDAVPVFYWARELGEVTLLGIPETRFAWSWALIMFGEFVSAEDAIQRMQLSMDSGDDGWQALFRQQTPQATALAIMFAIIRLFKGEMSPTLLDHLQRLYNRPGLSNSHRGTIDNVLARHAIQHCQFAEARERA